MSGARVECMVEELTEDRTTLTCMGGSSWVINPGDLSTVTLWLPADVVVFEETDSSGTFNWKGTRSEDGKSAWFQRVT